MALFGLFGKKDEAAELKKLATKATAKFGPPENRVGALAELRKLGTPDALGVMLQRFTVRVDPTITDDEEKQYVFESVVEAGEKAVEPVKKFIEKTEQPTWGLRILDELLDESELIGVVLAVLEKEGPEYTRDPEKKITLIRYLEGRTHADIGTKLVPFLEDPSEDVRSATVEVLARLADEATREPLIATLLRAHADNSERLKRLAASALAMTKFPVKGHTPAVQAALPSGFALDKAGVVSAR